MDVARLGDDTSGQSQDSYAHYCDDFHHHQQGNDGDLLSPTGFGGGEEHFGLSLTRQQIKDHNCKLGWQQWITLKGKVYDTTSFRDHFIAYNKKKAAVEENAVLSEEQKEESPLSPETCNYTPDHEFNTIVGQCISSRIADTIDDLLLQGRALDEENRERETTGVEDGSYGDDHSDDNNAEEEEYDEEEDSISENSSSDNIEFLWKYNVITALQKTGLGMREIETEIRPFMIGTLQNPPSWKYWASIRTDALALYEDLASKDSTDMGRYEHEYFALIQRWLRKYRDIDPAEKHAVGDGNINIFFFAEDPDSLREWVNTSRPFDTDVPDSGAWASTELLLSPLGDTHDVFSSALRAHNSSLRCSFSHEIHGKVAWAELPQDVIKNDQMTQQQQLVHESRLRRGDRAHDPALMKRRRQRLGQYFMRQYKYSEEMIAVYLQWASVMEQNQRDLEALCRD